MCGNGTKEGTEACDDGNNSDNDACDTTCASSFVLCDGRARAGCYRTPAIMLGTYSVTEIGDFDGDAHLDIAVAPQGPGPLRILYGDGRGAFTEIGFSIGLNIGNLLAVGDFDGDGRHDVVVNGIRMCNQVGGAGDAGINVYRGLADRTLGPRLHIEPSVSRVTGIITIQMDSDPTPELLMWTYCQSGETTVRVLDSNFAVIAEQNNWFAPDRFAIANLDADPQQEMLTSSDSGGSHATNTLFNDWPNGQTYFLAPEGFVSASFFDADGDGLLDLIGDNSTYGLINGMQPNQGAMAWRKSITGPVTKLPLARYLAGPVVGYDYDHDGRTDLGIAHANQPTFTVYFRQPNGSYANPVRTQTGLDSHGMGLGSARDNRLQHADFNEDGIPDLIIHSLSAGFLLLSQ